MIRLLPLLALLGTGGCDAAEPPIGFPTVLAPRTGVRSASGLPAPAVLYPRHRILSPTPPIVLAVPAGVGALEIVIVTDRCRRRIRSRDRVIPWPAEVPALRHGDAGWVRVGCGLGRGSSGFVRVREPAYRDRWLEGPEQSVRGLSRSGLPMEALRLAARECLPLGGWIGGYRGRAGLSPWGAWREIGLPGSIPVHSPDP